MAGLVCPAPPPPPPSLFPQRDFSFLSYKNEKKRKRKIGGGGGGGEGGNKYSLHAISPEKIFYLINFFNTWTESGMGRGVGRK